MLSNARRVSPGYLLFPRISSCTPGYVTLRCQNRDKVSKSMNLLPHIKTICFASATSCTTQSLRNHDRQRNSPKATNQVKCFEVGNKVAYCCNNGISSSSFVFDSRFSISESLPSDATPSQTSTCCASRKICVISGICSAFSEESCWLMQMASIHNRHALAGGCLARRQICQMPASK